MAFQKGHKINIGNKYRLGKPAWNKGTKGIMKSNKTSFKKGEHPSIETQFKKGQISWNKGLKFPEWSGINNPFYGKKHTKEALEKMSKAQDGRVGELAANWKGGYVYDKRYSMNMKGTFTKKEWENLKRKYNFMCLCCKQQEPFIKLEADHVIPVASWDAWIIDHTEITYKCGEIQNIQPLCRNCNARKFTKVIDYRTNIKQYA